MVTSEELFAWYWLLLVAVGYCVPLHFYLTGWKNWQTVAVVGISLLLYCYIILEMSQIPL